MTISPDGSILAASGTGNLITSAGTWTFSTQTVSTGNLILLNGQTLSAGGAGVEMEVANHGNLYVDNSQGSWYEWSGSTWIAATNPTPTTLSPDGTVLLPGSGGSLVTAAGAWTFGQVYQSPDYYIQLNGQTLSAGGAGVEMEVAHGGNLYADNSQGQWWAWNGSRWTSSTNPTLGTAQANSSTSMVASSDSSRDAAAPLSDLILPKPSFDQHALRSDHAFTFADVSDPRGGASQAAGPVPTIFEMPRDAAQSFGPNEISTVSALSFSTDNPTVVYDKVLGHHGSA
jgi:hypothetical protein